jgi:hypothetical protein
MQTMLLRFLLAILFLLLLPAARAEARMSFGTQDDIHFLQNVKLTGPNGEALLLGYMTQSRHIIAPVYMEDRGYALGLRFDQTRYFRMPTGDELRQYQKAGLLPDPLPPYRLTVGNYIMGYFLWFALGVMALIYGAFCLFRRRLDGPTPTPRLNPSLTTFNPDPVISQCFGSRRPHTRILNCALNRAP